MCEALIAKWSLHNLIIEGIISIVKEIEEYCITEYFNYQYHQ